MSDERQIRTICQLRYGHVSYINLAWDIFAMNKNLNR